MQKQNVGISAASVVSIILTAVYMTCTMIAPGDLEFPSAWTAATAFVCMVACLFAGLPSAAWVSLSGFGAAFAVMPARYLAFHEHYPDDRVLPIAILALFGLGFLCLVALATLRRLRETNEPWQLCVVRTTLFVSIIGDIAVILGSFKPSPAINVVPAKA